MLLAFDLDKTLLTNNYELPRQIARAIKAARSKGHDISILTGRPFMSALPYLQQLGVSEYYSTNHGSLVIGSEGSVLQHKRLDAVQVKTILEPFSDHPEVEFSCILDDELYVKNPDDERWHWAHTQSRQVVRYHKGLEIIADKVVFSANGLTPNIHKHVQQIYPEFVVYLWQEGYLEITPANADKGTALRLLALERGIPQSEVVAFGDGPNDVSMLSYASRAVAVGPEAHPDLLAVADEHIAAPEEHGVVHWLETNVL